MNFSSGESNFYVRGDKGQDEFVEQSTNARLIVPILFSQFFSRPFYGRYFPLYSPLKLSSPYTCSSSKPPLEQLSHQFSSSAFLNDNLPSNTIQRSTPYKCGHNGRYSAFNVEVAALPQIFWNLPSSQGVCEVFLRGRNFLQYHYIGPSKQFEPYSIDPRRNISSGSFPVISHVRNSSGQTLAVFNLLVYLLGNSDSWIRIRIQYLLICALTSPRPNMLEFWISAPTLSFLHFSFPLRPITRINIYIFFPSAFTKVKNMWDSL